MSSLTDGVDVYTSERNMRGLRRSISYRTHTSQGFDDLPEKKWIYALQYLEPDRSEKQNKHKPF